MIIYLIVFFLFFYFLFNIVPKIPAALKIKKGTDLILKGKYREGLKLFEKGVQSKYIKPFSKIRYAFTELKYGDISKAKKQISLLLNSGGLKQSERYEAKSVWALINYIEGDMEQAEETCEELYKNYLNTDIYCTLGYIYNITKTPGEAVKFNLEAYDYNSDKAVIADNLGQAYYLNSQIDEAEKIYAKTVEKEPDFPEFWYNYALVKKAEGQNNEAIAMLDKALEKEFHNLTTVSADEVKELKAELEGMDK